MNVQIKKARVTETSAPVSTPPVSADIVSDVFVFRTQSVASDAVDEKGLASSTSEGVYLLCPKSKVEKEEQGTKKSDDTPHKIDRHHSR